MPPKKAKPRKGEKDEQVRENESDDPTKKNDDEDLISEEHDSEDGMYFDPQADLHASRQRHSLIRAPSN